MNCFNQAQQTVGMSEDAPGEVIDILQGTVEDLEEYVEENKMHPDDLKELLEMESHLQDRKTARKLLETELRETEVTKDISEAREELSDLRKVLRDLGGTEEPEYEDVSREEMLEALGMNIEEFEQFLADRDISPEQLRNLKEMEKLVNDRKTVKEQLNDEISREVFHQDVVDIETDIEDLEKDLEELEDDSPDAVRELLENNIAAVEQQEDTDENQDDQEGQPDQEGDEKEKEDESEDSGAEGEEETEAGEGTSSRMDRKKELVEDMEVDMSEEELGEIPLEQLESIKEEKDEREKMIDELVEQGLSETELRHSSTSDLRKLSDEVEPEEDKEEVDTESLEEDARTDLDFVRGAVQEDEEEEEEEDEKSFQDRIKEFRNRIRDVTETEDEEEEHMDDIERLEKVMNEYQELENSRASVKIAQVLKGYLERQMEVSRELTYGEMSDKLEEYDGEDYGRLAEFFSRMQKETYTGRVSSRSVDDVVDSAMSVARDLEG